MFSRFVCPNAACSLSTGANVVDLGLAPTPIGYYSEVVGVPPQVTNYSPVTGAMIITASHNPMDYNGMKSSNLKPGMTIKIPQF